MSWRRLSISLKLQIVVIVLCWLLKCIRLCLFRAKTAYRILTKFSNFGVKRSSFYASRKRSLTLSIFFYQDENVASCKQVQDYISRDLLSFSSIYWYLFKMYAYCSLGSSLRSFLVINIVRKGFRVPFWNCFGAKPAVLRIRFKICMCKQHEQ